MTQEMGSDMTRLSQQKVWCSTAIVFCMSLHFGCSKGIPGLLKAPMLGKSIQADLGATLRPEPQLQESGGWITSWELAHRESLRTGKPIMAIFTGSDWCGPCIALKKKVLSTDQFSQWASENVVLLEVDFPKKSNQLPAIIDQNRELSNRYNIAGYPTVLIIDTDGKVKGKLGHGTNPKRWIERAAAIVGS
jgi:protein disulfide-isomerase